MKHVLLLFFAFCVATPCFAQNNDTFATDERLYKKHTIKAAGIPLKELLEQLTKDTGVELTAGPSVAEDKVILFALERPLADSLRVIARFFNFNWTRAGRPGSFTYTLSQNRRQRRAEQAEIDSEFSRAADQILKEALLLREYSGRSADEGKEILHKMGLPPQRYGEPVELSRLEGARVAAGFLSALGRNGILRLLRATESTDLAWPTTPGRGKMEPALREEIIKASMEQNARRNVQVKDFDFVRFTIGRDPATEPVTEPLISGSAVAGSKTSGTSGIGFRFPIHTDFDQNMSGFPFKPVDWRTIPALNRKAMLDMRITYMTPTVERKPLPPPLMASLLTALAETAHQDTIADAFYSTQSTYSTQLTTSIGISLPLGSALDVLARGTNHRWGHVDGFVMLRDRHYVVNRRNEPSLRDLRRWASLSNEALYSLNTLAEIAAQPYSKYKTTREVLGNSGIIEDHQGIFNWNRGHLVFWNALAPAQKAAALSPRGLPYSGMTREQRRLFEVASLGTGDYQEMNAKNPDIAWPIGEIRKAAYAVDVIEYVMWGLKGGFASSGTREEVFNERSKQNPDLRIDQLQEGRTIQYAIHYRSPAFRRFGLLRMPGRWLESGSATVRSRLGERL